ncbi:protein RIK isoform X1 [Punica granatum]|uniref:Protein RIK n=1 Tax=Punica granatum TaxID=22663 RepID=A0A6P8DQ87_PUNGR|nr:protein RIK isoform X1 [Punica granatum]
MTEDGGPRVSSDETQTRQRKKRKWDQPAEPFLLGGLAVPGILPLSNLGSLPGFAVPNLVPLPSTVVPTPWAPSCATMYAVLPAHSIPQQSSAANPKLNQVNIQEDLVIAREIIINDAEPSLRHRLTKRQTQEEIQKCTGAVVITRGKYRPPGAPSDGEKPLYLHISSRAHLKDTAERIIAVDCAAAMIEEMLKQGPNFQFPGFNLPVSNGVKVNQGMSVCVYLGFDVDPSLDIAARIRGPNDLYVSHIINETGATVSLRGCGSAASESTNEEDGEQPLHLLLSSNNSKSLEEAKRLAEHLLDTISIECGASRASSSSKVYGAVPPPQQLLPVTQSSGHKHEVSTNPAAVTLHISSTAVPAASSTPAVPLANNLFPPMPAAQTGAIVGNGLSSQNMGNYSGSSLTSGTRYKGYEGIYPQATPLQQVAMALKQSPSFASASAHATTLPSTGAKSSASSGSEKEKEKQLPQKRKFQELPVGHTVSTKLNQVLDLVKFGEQEADSCARDLAMMLPPKLVPPSLHGTSLPAPRSMAPPPPVPKFTSSRPNPDSVHKNKGLKNTGSDSVPDTLVKLMEYGDEDDDPDEVPSGPLNSSKFATQKPFWAV